MFEKMKSIIAAQLNVSEDEVTEEASFKDDLIHLICLSLLWLLRKSIVLKFQWKIMKILKQLEMLLTISNLRELNNTHYTYYI